MAGRYRTRQLGKVVDRFKDDCGSDVWDEVLIAYAILIEKGPMCGGLIAKKLKGGDGIWELIAHYDNLQPRLLFYYPASRPNEIVFVHAFMKKGNQDYPPAITLAKQRRRSVEQGEKELNEFPAGTSNVH